MPSPRSAANPASHPSEPRASPRIAPPLPPVGSSPACPGRAAVMPTLRRMLRPGGQVGFSDLVFDRPPTAAEDRALRALLYHSARELLTDWPGLFTAAGFQLRTVRDIQAQTLPTGQHARPCTGSTRRRYGCATAGGSALVSPAVSTARSPWSPLRSDAAAATRR